MTIRFSAGTAGAIVSSLTAAPTTDPHVPAHHHVSRDLHHPTFIRSRYQGRG